MNLCPLLPNSPSSYPHINIHGATGVWRAAYIEPKTRCGYEERAVEEWGAGRRKGEVGHSGEGCPVWGLWERSVAKPLCLWPYIMVITIGHWLVWKFALTGSHGTQQEWARLGVTSLFLLCCRIYHLKQRYVQTSVGFAMVYLCWWLWHGLQLL